MPFYLDTCLYKLNFRSGFRLFVFAVLEGTTKCIFILFFPYRIAVATFTGFGLYSIWMHSSDALVGSG